MLAHYNTLFSGNWCTLPNFQETAREADACLEKCSICLQPERCEKCHKQLCHPVNGDCRPSNKAMFGHYYAKSGNGAICMECHDKGCE